MALQSSSWQPIRGIIVGVLLFVAGCVQPPPTEPSGLRRQGNLPDYPYSDLLRGNPVTIRYNIWVNNGFVFEGGILADATDRYVILEAPGKRRHLIPWSAIAYIDYPIPGGK